MVGSDAAIFLEKMGKVIFGQRAGLSQILKTDRIGVIEGNIAISLHQSGIRGCIGRHGNGGVVRVLTSRRASISSARILLHLESRRGGFESMASVVRYFIFCKKLSGSFGKRHRGLSRR